MVGARPTRSALSTGRSTRDGKGADDKSVSPVDGSTLARFKGADSEQVEFVIKQAKEAFENWRLQPAPQRAEVILSLAKNIEERQEELAQLMTLEMGKPIRESMGEVANAVETFRYAAGLSRRIYGMEAPSVSKNVTLLERWHPMGPVLVITAFNFPAALWAWNVSLAIVCGNSTIWKPAPQTPLFTMAMMRVVATTLASHEEVPDGVFSMILGSNEEVAIPLVNSPDIPVVSATGSVPMGQKVGEAVGKRLGRTILELGGNSSALFTPSADMEVSLRHTFFSATLNGGQRCTALRRLQVHEDRFDAVVERLKKAYKSWPVGNVFEQGHRLPPLVDDKAKQMYDQKIAQLKEQGVEVFEPELNLPTQGSYVQPALAILKKDDPQPQDETFGPLLYVQPYGDFKEAIRRNNDVPQGLSSGIFGNDLGEVMAFTGPAGSDCGMVACNDNTGGLEVSMAFGGDKDSGGGREKGSDAWKSYMRRQSVVLNTSGVVPPDAGIDFGE